MEDVYFYDGDGPYTWNQLLFLLSKKMGHVEWRWSRARNEEYWRFDHTPFTRRELDEFFSDYCHCDNDVGCTEGRYHWVVDGRLACLPSLFWKKTQQVVDNHGRVINSADIRLALLGYRPNLEDRVARPRRRKRVVHGYRFRCDPVPNIGHYRNESWHKYRGNHGHTIQELRQWHRDVLVKKDLELEFGLSIKLGRDKSELDPWNHGHHVGCHGYGWKRSKKQKQWMKHGWKRVYPDISSSEEKVEE